MGRLNLYAKGIRSDNDNNYLYFSEPFLKMSKAGEDKGLSLILKYQLKMGEVVVSFAK